MKTNLEIIKEMPIKLKEKLKLYYCAFVIAKYDRGENYKYWTFARWFNLFRRSTIKRNAVLIY